MFQGWVPSLDKWTKTLLNVLGMSEDDLESAQEEFVEAAPALRREQLELLNVRIGIEVPEVPAGARTQQPGAWRGVKW